MFGLEFDNGCLAEGHTEAAMCEKWWLQKFDHSILKPSVFPTLKKFTKVETLATFDEIYQKLTLSVVHTKIFV